MGVKFEDAGLYSVVVSSPFGSITNTPAQLVVNAADVSISLCPDVVIRGVVGYSYIIQSSIDLTDANAWITETNLTLVQPIYYWDDRSVDASKAGHPRKFYRVLPGL